MGCKVSTSSSQLQQRAFFMLVLLSVGVQQCRSLDETAKVQQNVHPLH